VGNSYTDLEVWQLSIDLVTDVYAASQRFPPEEIYGLASQVRKAAVSVPSNIAEGQGRVSSKDFHHFLAQARGSLMEVETQLVIAERLGYLEAAHLKKLLDRSGRVKSMLYRLMQSITDAPAPKPPIRSSLSGRRGTGNGGPETGNGYE
jgi:four helix bundle protein